MTSNATRAKLERARAVVRRRLRVDDYVTAGQLVELTGVSKNSAIRVLEELVAAGEAVCLDRHSTKGHPRRYASPEKAA